MTELDDLKQGLADMGAKVAGVETTAAGSGQPQAEPQAQTPATTETTGSQSQEPVNTTPAAQPAEMPAITLEVEPKAPAPATPATPAFDESAWIAKTFGEKFKSVDELKQTMQRNEKLIEPVSERVAHFNEFIRKGGTEQEYMSTQMADYKNMDALQVLVAKTKSENPHMDVKEIEAYLKLQYKIGEENEYDEREAQKGQFELKRDAEKARADMVELQKKFSVPDAALKAQAANDANMETVRQWQEGAKKAMDGFDKVNIRVNKDISYEYQVDADTKARIEKFISDPLALIEHFGENQETLRNFLFKAEAFDKAIAAIANRHAAQSTEKLLGKIENAAAQTGKPTSPVTAQTAQQAAQQAYEGLMASKGF